MSEDGWTLVSGSGTDRALVLESENKLQHLRGSHFSHHIFMTTWTKTVSSLAVLLRQHSSPAGTDLIRPGEQGVQMTVSASTEECLYTVGSELCLRPFCGESPREEDRQSCVQIVQ